MQGSTHLELPGKMVKWSQQEKKKAIFEMLKDREQSQHQAETTAKSLEVSVSPSSAPALWSTGPAGDRVSWTCPSPPKVQLRPLSPPPPLHSGLSVSFRTSRPSPPFPKSADTLKKLSLSISITSSSDGHPSCTLLGLWEDLLGSP